MTATPRPDLVSEPLYAATVDALEWSPADLRPPYDLDEVIGKSYERILIRHNLRHLIEKRAKLKRSRRRPRRLVRPLP